MYMQMPQLEMMEFGIYTLKKLLREREPEKFTELIGNICRGLKDAHKEFRPEIIETIPTFASITTTREVSPTRNEKA